MAATFSTGSAYTPGTPIKIAVTVSDPINTHYGFQMTARLDSNQLTGQAGDFTAGPGQIVLCDNGSPKGSKGCSANALVQFIEHNTPATAPWTFTWTPPTTDVGPVHFYVAGNAVNFNTREDAGDHVYTASYTLFPAAACVTSSPIITKVNTASAYGGFLSFGPGSWLEIFGSNFTTATSWIWGGADFNGVNAPTSLDKVSVSVGGKPAFVYFTSPGQINVEAPADSTTPDNVPVTVTNCTQTSAPFMFQKNALVPGMLAPPDSFVVGGKQFLVAQFADGTYVLNAGAIRGITSRPAKPGETITVYGVGFGDVNPSFSPGVIVSGLNSLTNPLKVSFGSTVAAVSYDGLAPNFVGLYQFNIMVPNVADGDYPILVTLNGTALQQSFFLTVHK